MHLFTLPNGSDVQLERNSLLVSNHTYPNADILAEIARVFPRRKTSKVIASINIERVIQFVRCIFPRYTSTLDPRNDHFKLQTDKWDGTNQSLLQLFHRYQCYSFSSAKGKIWGRNRKSTSNFKGFSLHRTSKKQKPNTIIIIAYIGYIYSKDYK